MSIQAAAIAWYLSNQPRQLSVVEALVNELTKAASLPNQGPLTGGPKLPSLGGSSVQSSNPTSQVKPSAAIQTPATATVKAGPNAPQAGWKFGQGVVAPNIMQPKGGVDAVMAQNRMKIAAVHALGDAYPPDWNGGLTNVIGDISGKAAWDSCNKANATGDGVKIETLLRKQAISNTLTALGM